MNKFLITALIFCLGTGAILGQEITSLPLAEYQMEQENFGKPDKVEKEQSQIKMYYFVSSLGFVLPGVGLSVRKGIMAYDFTIHSLFGQVNSASCTASTTWYLSSSKYRPYASIGVGPVGFSSQLDSSFGMIVPVRFGLESDYFSADIGACSLWLLSWSDQELFSEARLGYRF